MSQYDNCTIDTCPIDTSSFHYRPSLALNSILLALFGVSLVCNLVQGLSFKTWGFMIAMVLGCISEVIGYGARIWAYNEPWAANPVCGLCSLFAAFVADLSCSS